MLKKDHLPICDLSSDSINAGMWVSADQSGEITIWKELNALNSIAGYGYVCAQCMSLMLH
jgi:hypothetical protein